MKHGTDTSASFNVLLQKLKKYCAWRERCQQEAVQKLHQLSAAPEQTKQILQLLTDEGFLNNQRFARMFAQGKLHNNKWGKQRIRMELLKRQIAEKDIRGAIEAIDENEYLKVLKQLMHGKREELLKKKDPFAKEKTLRYCIQKGYEPDLVWQEIDQLY